MFVILATETFALFQPGEPFFLQFTPLLQEIDQALHLTINEGVSSVDEFNMVLKKHVQGLHKKQESGMEIVNREEDHFILLNSSFDTLPFSSVFHYYTFVLFSFSLQLFLSFELVFHYPSYVF